MTPLSSLPGQNDKEKRSVGLLQGTACHFQRREDGGRSPSGDT